MHKLNTALTTAPTTPAQSAESEAERVNDIPAALAHFDKLPDSAHVRLPIVAALFGVSTATVWRWVKSGRLPAAKSLGPNTTAWRVGELRRAQAAQARG